MKIVTNEVVENHSLEVAKSFAKGIDVDIVTEFCDSDELILYVPNLSNTLFSAEALQDMVGAYEFFSEKYRQVIIVPENHIDFYKFIESTVIYFAGGKLWRTASRLPVNPIMFGKESLIKQIITEGDVKFNNGIFYGGETTIIASLPSIIANLDEEQMPVISSAMFDIESYKTMIEQVPSYKEESPKEMINEEN